MSVSASSYVGSWTPLPGHMLRNTSHHSPGHLSLSLLIRSFGTLDQDSESLVGCVPGKIQSQANVYLFPPSHPLQSTLMNQTTRFCSLLTSGIWCGDGGVSLGLAGVGYWGSRYKWRASEWEGLVGLEYTGWL